MKMKKLLVILFIGTVGAVACGKKIMPDAGTNNPSRSENDKTANASSQPANTNTSATTSPSFNNMKGSVTLPDNSSPANVSMDQEKTVYVTKCKTCHALKTPSDYTIDQMKNILKVEIPKANLSKKEADQVTAYLLANAKK